MDALTAERLRSNVTRVHSNTVRDLVNEECVAKWPVRVPVSRRNGPGPSETVAARTPNDRNNPTSDVLQRERRLLQPEKRVVQGGMGLLQRQQRPVQPQERLLQRESDCVRRETGNRRWGE